MLHIRYIPIWIQEELLSMSCLLMNNLRSAYARPPPASPGTCGRQLSLTERGRAALIRSMTSRLKLVLTCAWLAWLFNGSLPAAQPPKVIALWPGAAPGDQGELGEEHDTTKPTDGQVAGKPVVRLGNVSKPTLTLYRPAPDKDTGVAVMVCPGGGYNILAMDLEGTEVCEWLNSLGITGALLKYRVPKRPGLEKHAAALQDAQRALGLLRQQSRAYGIDPKRIGVLGFSGGGRKSTRLKYS